MKEIEKILRLETSLPRWYFEVSFSIFFTFFRSFRGLKGNEAVCCPRKFERNRSKWISKRLVDDTSTSCVSQESAERNSIFFQQISFFFFYLRRRISTRVRWFPLERGSDRILVHTARFCRSNMFVFRSINSSERVCTSFENVSRTLFRKVAYIAVDFPTIWKLLCACA